MFLSNFVIQYPECCLLYENISAHDRDHGPKVDLHDDELDLFAKIILVIIDDWGVYDDVLSEQNTCNKLEILKRLLIKKADAFRNNSLYGDTL